MEIGGLQKLTLIDYPGRLAATVFLIGCDFRCPFCYSSELVLPEKIKNQPRIPEKEFFKFLKERKGLLEGVTICGGEPCINKDLPQFCKKIKKHGYLVKLDTNGSKPEMLKSLIDKKLIDYVAMDIKAPLDERYWRASGVKCDLEAIGQSIDFLLKDELDYEFRTTVCPTFSEKKDILDIARQIEGAKQYTLQNFRPVNCLDPQMEKVSPFPKEVLREMALEAGRFVREVSVRGEAPSVYA